MSKELTQHFGSLKLANDLSDAQLTRLYVKYWKEYLKDTNNKTLSPTPKDFLDYKRTTLLKFYKWLKEHHPLQRPFRGRNAQGPKKSGRGAGCNQCAAKIRSGKRRCLRRASCGLGCKKYCYQHAQNHRKGKSCND